ncbi:MAG: hypothetical protein M9938_05900 [Solirubrobacterales bacterium]|nr:hypothetical protein [Solirubrobacterales bacterium]
MDPDISEMLAAHAAGQNATPSIDETALALSVRKPADPAARTGILLINHGSRSATWRKLLLDVQREISGELLEIPGVAQVRTAFMEYTEPSIATQLRAFDEDGIERVIVVPLLLTISDHSFDDIPAICGMSDDADVLAELADEKIEVYAPKATLDFAPLLDFSGLVQRNTARRVNAILGRRDESSEISYGLVLVGYGSAEFNDDWDRFFAQIRSHAEQELGITETAHAWCGHLVSYSRQPTMDAIESVLEKTDRVILLPILIAYDQMFQEKIIGRAATRCAEPDRVLYRPDSILPEPEVGRWVVEICQKMARGRVETTA